MTARRVFVSISSKSAHWPEASEPQTSEAQISGAQISDSTKAAIDVAMDLIEREETITPPLGEPKMLVEERWGSRTHVVFDLFHETYNPEEAHLPGYGNLPVIAVWLSGTEVAQVATEGLRNRVNEEVRDTHRKFGKGGKPPFFIDHSGGKVPLFVNPRTMSNKQ